MELERCAIESGGKSEWPADSPLTGETRPGVIPSSPLVPTQREAGARGDLGEAAALVEQRHALGERDPLRGSRPGLLPGVSHSKIDAAACRPRARVLEPCDSQLAAARRAWCRRSASASSARSPPPTTRRRGERPLAAHRPRPRGARERRAEPPRADTAPRRGAPGARPPTGGSPRARIAHPRGADDCASACTSASAPPSVHQGVAEKRARGGSRAELGVDELPSARLSWDERRDVRHHIQAVSRETR